MTVHSREWLRALRQKRCLRQVDISRGTAALDGRINQTTVSRLETGRCRASDLTAAQVAALCQVLEITSTEWVAHVGSSGGQIREGSK